MYQNPEQEGLTMYENPEDHDCRNCKHGKDRFKDSCYCTYYGYIRSRPKKDCWGWNKAINEPETAEGEKGGMTYQSLDNYRKSYEGT